MSGTATQADRLDEIQARVDAATSGDVANAYHAKDDVLWLLDEVKRRDAVLHAVLEWHVPDTHGDWCAGCGFTYPCATVRTIAAAQGADHE